MTISEFVKLLMEFDQDSTVILGVDDDNGHIMTGEEGIHMLPDADESGPYVGIWADAHG